MPHDYVEIAIRLGSAWAAGSVIGLERSFHGRPAGFRTHALVCLASALLVMLTAYQQHWLHATSTEIIRADPTRMAQGLMTGIGFLGAGVIFKEGLSVRGLTTAASIWITAAIGILFGVGFYYPALIATGITLVTLAVFRLVEYRMPTQYFAYSALRYASDKGPDADEVRRLVEAHGFSISHMSYRLTDGGAVFEYRMVISTMTKGNVERLAEALRTGPDLVEFRISPMGD